MKLFIPSMALSAAWTNDRIAAEEMPCASGELRESAGALGGGRVGADALCAGAIATGAPCAAARCETAVRKASETATRRAFIWSSVEEMASGRLARSTREQLEPLRRQRVHRRD